MTVKILVADDEASIREVVQLYLEREGFVVHSAADGDAALELEAETRPDLLILDIMLPGRTGWEICRALTRRVPVIFLTAKSTEADKITGFSLGADDYVTKPFSPKELLLRVKVALKRSQAVAEAAEVLATGPFRFDLPAFICYMDQLPLELTLTEYKLLLYLCERAETPCERTDLLRGVWGYSDAANSRTLDTHVKRLRAKLGPHADCIETARNIGYVLRIAPRP